MSDSARIAYLCSPNPVIVAHAEDRKNREPENNLAVERVIERLMLPTTPHKPEDRDIVLAGLVEKFWQEREDFIKRRNYFSRANIWIIAEREDTMSYEWHKRYSCPCTEVFGPVACLTASDATGCGQAERNWKAMKAQKTGKRSNLSSDKMMKQAVISAAYARHKNDTKRLNARKAGVLWTDEDFEFCKIDHYCAGSIIEDLVEEPTRTFHAYLEDWEDVQFNSKGDEVHAARISAKYGGIKYYDDEKDQIGMIHELDCAILTKCIKTGDKKTRTQKVGPGFGYFYTVLGYYEGFIKDVKPECQVDSLFDTWERMWDFYDMIVDYYAKYPDSTIKIVLKSEVDNDGGGGKMPARD